MTASLYSRAAELNSDLKRPNVAVQGRPAYFPHEGSAARATATSNGHEQRP